MKKALISYLAMRPTTASEMHLPHYDNTKLQAVNTCPTWGILRYGMHLTMSSGDGKESPALATGRVCHDVFAAARLWQLWRVQGNETLAHAEAVRVLGADRLKEMLSVLSSSDDDDTQFMNFCLVALTTSGYEDNPRDRRRTMTNIEEACIEYLRRYSAFKYPVWISADQSMSGIEMPFDMMVETNLGRVRFVGKIDGLHMDGITPLLMENKTASRLGDAWEQTFYMSSQITGYMLAASVLAGVQVYDAHVYGLAIPLPKSFHLDGFTDVYVHRSELAYIEWVQWLWHSVSMYEEYRDDPYTAPKYTHSCGRYFRTCSMLPFCTAPDQDERQDIIRSMEHDEWSPLHELAPVMEE